MVEKVFHDFVKGLCFYYERRDPREEALDLWFQQVKHIPDEPVGWMSGQIRGRHESYPRNLPLVMRELWQQWMEDHPQWERGERQISSFLHLALAYLGLKGDELKPRMRTKTRKEV